MIRNYFKITLRSLMKYRLTAFINLFGLTLGLTCCLLILTYVLHETSYDRFHPKADRTYRITRNFLNGEGEATFRLNAVAPPIALLLKNDFPEIEKETVLLNGGFMAVKNGDRLFTEERAYFADEHVFDVFGFRVLKGNPRTALAEPFSLMLEEEMARKYFGSEDPMNRVLRISNQFDVKVTGVYKGLPSNAHIHPSMFISFNTLKDPRVYGEEQLKTNWSNNSFLTYVVLPEGYPGSKLEAQLPAFLDRHHPNAGGMDGQKPSTFTTLNAQPLTDIHLRSHLDSEEEPPGDITRVYIFSVIALFILLIACINYMNLSTARAALRAKEIGVRKVVGAQRKEIIAQFLGESVLITYAAMALAIGAAFLAMPALSKLSGVELSMQSLIRWDVLAPLALVPLLVGVLSGIYPALFMSAFRPQLILKGLFRAGGGSLSFRKVLVVAQFSISIILIIATGVVFQQLSYIRKKPLGYNKDQVLVMPYQSTYNPGYQAFRNQLLANPAIKDAGRSSRIPTGRLLDDMGASIRVDTKFSPTKTPIKCVAVDHQFLPTYGVAMAAGRNYSREFRSDTASFVLNETAVRMIGWKSAQDAIGRDMAYGGTKGKVIGVTKDFHFESLHQPIVPLVFLLLNDPQNNFGGMGFGGLSIKIAGGDLQGAIRHVEKTWKKFYPDAPFTHAFVDENFEQLYQAEERQAAIFTLFACIAIFVACLGLLGLSAFAITQRVKEIGIRKVLGASVGSIAGLLSKDFLRLVIVAAFIAFPVAWYAMRQWLDGFAYRIDIPWWVFLASGLVTLLIALVTVASQTITVATANPVKSLRTE